MHLTGLIHKISCYLAELSYFWSLFLPIFPSCIHCHEIKKCKVMEQLYYCDHFLNWIIQDFQEYHIVWPSGLTFWLTILVSLQPRSEGISDTRISLFKLPLWRRNKKTLEIVQLCESHCHATNLGLSLGASGCFELCCSSSPALREWPPCGLGDTTLTVSSQESGAQPCKLCPRIWDTEHNPGFINVSFIFLIDYGILHF